LETLIFANLLNSFLKPCYVLNNFWNRLIFVTTLQSLLNLLIFSPNLKSFEFLTRCHCFICFFKYWYTLTFLIKPCCFQQLLKPFDLCKNLGTFVKPGMSFFKLLFNTFGKLLTFVNLFNNLETLAKHTVSDQVGVPHHWPTLHTNLHQSCR
jgi:hypothetical protein